MNKFSIFACLFFAQIILINAQGVALIPRSLLLEYPTISAPRLSHDGATIAYLAPDNRVMNIWVRSVNADTAACITHDTQSIRRYWWAYDNKTILYFQDVHGNENWNLFAVDTVTGSARNLTPFPDVQVRLIAYSRKYPNVVLIGMNKDNKAYHDVYKVDIYTGVLELVEKNQLSIAGFDMEQAWYADHDLNIRIVLHIDDEANTTVLARKNVNEPWQKLLVWDVNASAVSMCLGFSNDNETLYVADASESETAQLVEINLQTHEKKILAHDTMYDIISDSFPVLYNYHPAFFKHPITHKILAVFLECDTCRTLILDDSIREDIEFLEQLDKGQLSIRSTDDSFEKWIVLFIKSNKPNQYYVYERATKKLTPLIKEKDPLLDYPLATTEPISFSARDGLTIHGYLTRPVDVQQQESLPLVALVHGGPWIRDVWCFDEIVQLLANRGYVCLQVNFRASSGYGKSLVKAGNKEYGRAMQHDLTDGVMHLVSRGIVDPKRVAIMGWSYGGYAALAGAAFTPDVYACAVDLYGRVNLITTPDSIPPYWEKSAIVWKYRRGDPIKEEAMLKERSPLFNADKIKIPMFIAHGAHDVRIKQTDSDKIVEALRKQNTPCEYLLFSNEGHGMNNFHNSMQLYGAIEMFLAQHLGGRFEK